MPRLPGIFTTDEYRILAEAGIPSAAVSKYSHRHLIPHGTRQQQIIALLGRDPWSGATAKSAVRPKIRQPAPAEAPAISNPAAANCQQNVKHCQIDISTRPHIEINPCVDDGVCLAVRTAAMRPVANTLLDARRSIPCTNCRQGIARAKAEAAKKVVHVGALVCSCGEPKSRDAKECQDCAKERRRALA